MELVAPRVLWPVYLYNHETKNKQRHGCSMNEFVNVIYSIHKKYYFYPVIAADIPRTYRTCEQLVKGPH